MRTFFLAAGACVLLGPSAAYLRGAESDEPTPIETLCLEWINRCRANPTADSVRIVPKRLRSEKFDVAMFHREMAQASPAPPLVFDLKLILAARLHSRYQIVNGQTHVQTQGRPGFTGVQPWDRMKAAGFAGHGYAENVFVRSDGPWDSHQMFVVDIGDGGSGGMQPGRGHRKNILSPTYNAIGVGAIVHGDGKLAVTHNFSADRQRRVGGVVYNDRNKNRFYDVGEGVGDFAIAAGDVATRSWQSGAYALAVAGDAEQITVEFDRERYVRKLPASKANAKVDILMPTRAELKRVDALIAKLPAAGGSVAREKLRFKQLINLYYLAQSEFVRATAQEKIDTLTADLASEIAAVHSEVRAAAESGDTKSARALVAKHNRRFANTPVADWLREALACITVSDAYRKLAAAADNGGRISKGVIGRNQQTLAIVEAKCTSADWKEFLAGIRKAYRALAAANEMAN